MEYSSHKRELVSGVNNIMKFQNKTGMDVYVDMGGLKQVRAGEIVEFKGALKCPPLTPILESAVPKPKKPKKKTPTPPVSSTI